MSERVFALLVRLYPAAFRRKYSEEALQLYRDRLRDERGVVKKASLYCDLLTDTLIGLPLSWRNSYKEAGTAAAATNVNGVPSFHLLNPEPLKPGSVLVGCVFSATALVAFGFVMRLPAPHSFSNGGGALSPVDAVLERLNRVVSAPTNNGGDGDSTTVNGGSSQAQQTTSSPSPAHTSAENPLTEKERERIVQAVAENMTAHYFDQQKAEAAMERLRTLNKQGAYKGIGDGRALAERLTADIRSATGNPHLNVAYSSNAIPSAAPMQPSQAAMSRYRALMIEENCSVEKVEILPGNVGYLKFDSFPALDACSEMLHRAIAKVDGTNAVIFDLRDNTGGFPETVAEMAAPLFDHKVAWYNPRAEESASTLEPAAESLLTDKPVYILTSSKTLSGAEQFTYNLKMLKRATVIGETTGGGGHVGAFHRIDEHFGMGISETKITNPYGKPDWDGIGVEPDVKVNAADALKVANKMAARGVRP